MVELIALITLTLAFIWMTYLVLKLAEDLRALRHAQAELLAKQNALETSTKQLQDALKKLDDDLTHDLESVVIAHNSVALRVLGVSPATVAPSTKKDKLS